MSHTPVLSAKQQKGTLSGKKTKTKETIRNVLAVPYVKYWPLVPQGTDYEQLISTLGSYLEMIKPPVPLRIPWKELRKAPKAERKLLKIPPEFAGIVKTEKVERNIILGVNDINRALQKQPDTIKVILISSDVQPPLMVEHLIDQSVLYQIPILVIQGLRKLLKEKYGLGSIAIALKVSPQSVSLLEIIQAIYSQFPVPENHINYNRRLFKLCDKNVVEEINNESELNSKKLHFFRSDTSERCFIPSQQSNKSIKNTTTLPVDSMDFLAFSVDEIEVVIETKSDDIIYLSDKEDEVIVIPDTPLAKKSLKKSNIFNTPFLGKAYKSLSVKKMKGNVNRNKRKIDDMKNKVKKKTRWN